MTGNGSLVPKALRFAFILLFLQAPARILAASTPAGEQVFKQNCAVCHRAGSGTRAPLPGALRQLKRASILRALESGVMKAQGSQLTEAERRAVADFLGQPDTGPSKPGMGACANPAPLSGNAASWNGWGVSPANTNRRHQPARAA